VQTTCPQQKRYIEIKPGNTFKTIDSIFKTVAIGLMLILLCACGADSNVPESGSVSHGSQEVRQPPAETGIVPEGGSWTASQLNFSVSNDGGLVESFEVTYSGRATNDRCDFDYSDLAMVNDLVVENGVFTYDSDTLVIEGRFTAPQEAEVTVLWFGYYGGACQVDYNGELIAVATQSEATPED
jgi:hypothetical protein